MILKNVFLLMCLSFFFNIIKLKYSSILATSYILNYLYNCVKISEVQVVIFLKDGCK